MTKLDIEQMRADALAHLNILDTPPEERFERITRIATQIFDVPVAQLTLLDNERQWFKSNQGSDLTEVPRVITFCTHTVETDDGKMVIEDATEDARFDGNPIVHGEPFVRFYAGHSLYYNKDVRLGTLCILDSKPREMSQKDMQILEDLAAVAQRELVTIQLAMLDELTGLNNRRGFTTHAQTLLSFLERDKKSAVLVFIDMDNFKPINDKYGHQEGDSALIAFSRMLNSLGRASDIVARIGGDEFVAMFTDANALAAENLINKLREELRQYNDTNPLEYVIDFSAGIVEVDPSNRESLTDLLAKGDQLMYLNKQKRKLSQ